MHITAMTFWSLAITAIFAQNIVLIYLLASNVFFKALKSPVSGMMYGILVTIATTVSSALGYVIYKYILLKYNLSWLSPLAFVFVIALLEIAAEFLLMKFAPMRRKSLGKLLPVSAFNVAVLGLIFINVQMNTKGFLGTVFYGFCAGVGFIFALFITASAMERVQYSTPPAAFKGLPIALVTASLISLALMGFSGIQIPY